MNPQDTKLYASADYYLNGPEGMRNEVLMWVLHMGTTDNWLERGRLL